MNTNIHSKTNSKTQSNINLVQVNFTHADFIKQQGNDLLWMLNTYACDPMGGGQSLSDYTQKNLLSCLMQRTDFFTVMAYVGGKPAGFIDTIEGFSTFNARPLFNIHDVAVMAENIEGSV